MLTLPRNDRSTDGVKFLESCANEYNRLVDQSAAPPRFILRRFEKKFKNNPICKPDLVELSPVNINTTKPLKNVTIHKAETGRKAKEMELQLLRESSIVSKNNKSLKNVFEGLSEVPEIPGNNSDSENEFDNNKV